MKVYLDGGRAYFADSHNAQKLLEDFLKTKRYSVYLFAKAAHTLGITYFELLRLQKKDVLPCPVVEPPKVPLVPIVLNDSQGVVAEMIYRRKDQLVPLEDYWKRGRLPNRSRIMVMIKLAAQKLNLEMQGGRTLGFKDVPDDD